MTDFQRVAVIGAGVMGSGIAAHMANAGCAVLLLDMPPKDQANRNAITEGAIARLLKTDPAPFMHKSFARRIEAGNIEDDLQRLKDCDWIIEAIVEDPAAKRDLYRRIDKLRKPGSLVSSNTSTIPLAVLTEGMPASFIQDFLITHFFNPPRYMRLLEFVIGPQTRPEGVARLRDFADRRLGKTVVDCKDTPGFIANRIGTFWLQCSVIAASEGGLTVEEADAVAGPPMGFPKTGVFGLLDLVGIDLMPRVLDGLAASLPASDGFHRIYRKPVMIQKMIAEGYTGRKGKGGFYRLDTSDGKKEKQARNLKTGKYVKAKKAKFRSVKMARSQGLRALVEYHDRGGAYACRILLETLGYAAALVPEISDDIAAVDCAMRLGYNWKRGPFEMIDALGVAWFAAKLKETGRPVPKLLEIAQGRPFYRVQEGQRQVLTPAGDYTDLRRPEGVETLGDIKLRSRPIAGNRAASLWDIGDGVVCLEFHSKMNSLGMGTLAMIRKAIEIVPGRYRALVIHNEAENFSVGANLMLLLVPAFARATFLIRRMVQRGQTTLAALKYAPFPVVAAPRGLALGGGCEVVLHASAVQAHAETYIGLVETGVGLVPAWGGCKEMLTRWWTKRDRPQGPMPPVIKVFETVSMATVAKSAVEARDYLFLRPGDGITMNSDRLLADAKAKALELAENYEPPAPVEVSLPGPSAAAALKMAVEGFFKLGLATRHDRVVAGGLATVLSGGGTDMTEPLQETDLLRLECESFVDLACRSGTIARIHHILRTGRPLRN
jgi:3-hydroxyacyl-CoA dehydrogenase